MSDTWNHRVVNVKTQNGGEDWFTIREVFYEDGKPIGHTGACYGSETEEGLFTTLSRMLSALQLPVLNEDMTEVER